MNKYADIIITEKPSTAEINSMNDIIEILKVSKINKLKVLLSEITQEKIDIINSLEIGTFEQLELIIDAKDAEQKDHQLIRFLLNNIKHKNILLDFKILLSDISDLPSENGTFSCKDKLSLKLVDLVNSIRGENLSNNPCRDISFSVCITYCLDSEVSKLIPHWLSIRNKCPQIRHIVIELCNEDIKSNSVRLSLIEKDVSNIIRWIIQNGFSVKIVGFPLCYVKEFEEYSYETQQLINLNSSFRKIFEEKSKENQESISECKTCSINAICIGPDKKYFSKFGSSEIIRSFEQLNAISERSGNLPVDFTDNTSTFSDSLKTDLEIFEKSLKVKNNKNNIYDTYSHYLMEGSSDYSSKEYIFNCWKILVNRIESRKEIDNVNLYIHFPFCISSCDYCIYPSVQYKEQKQIEDYLDFLVSEMRDYSPIFKNIELKSLSIGGGTPSLMSEKQMDYLLSNIHKYFRFHPGAEKGIEFNPNTTTPEKLRLIDSYGFNKLSIGVQTLSKEVLMDINRGYQTFETVKNVMDEFKKTNIGFINIDLLIGLKKDTPDNFMYTLEEVMKLNPSVITVYPIKTNEHYIKTRFGTEENFFKFYYPLFEEISKRLQGLADRYGFLSSMSFDKLSYVHPFDLYPKKRNHKKSLFSYSNFKSAPYSNLGLGFYSQSNVNDMVNYLFISKTKEITSTLFLKNFSIDPKDYVFFASGFLDNYSKVKFITANVSESFSIDRKEYQDIFKSDICEDFAYAIKALTYLKKITIFDDKIEFNVKKELELYSIMLFFVGRKIVKDKINQWVRIIQ